MAKFIVHIGDGKCGSSSIQKGLFEARSALRNAGILYETSTPRNGHFNLATLVGQNTRSSKDHALQKAMQTVQVIRDKLRSDDTVLLTGESFFNLLPDRIVEILQTITPAIDRLDIIAYVRPPHRMYLSLVQQTLKADSTFPMPDQYGRRIDTILDTWQAFADKDSLTVRHFDREHLVDGDAFADFEYLLGHLMGRDDIHLPRSTENTTLSAEQLVVLQQYRAEFLVEFDGRAHQESQSLILYFEALNRLAFPGHKPALNKAALASLKRGNEQIIARVNRNFPGVALSLPEVSRIGTGSVTWKPEGGVAQILTKIDPEIVKLIKRLVPRFQPHVTETELSLLAADLNALSGRLGLSYEGIAKTTVRFWREMNANMRADQFEPMIAAPPVSAPTVQPVADPPDAAESSAPDTVTVPHPMILYGKNGWLFLKEDSNRVLDQITGNYRLKPDFQDSWQALFEHRKEMSQKLGYRYFYGIAPNKECVYADQLPAGVTVIEDRPVQQVLAMARDRVLHRYYLEPLREAARNEDIFVRGDTHWNHSGALIAFNEAMRALGLPGMEREEFNIDVRNIEADLSMKIGQLCPATVLTVKTPRFKMIFNNKVNNIGQCRIYENEDKSLPRCVYFRDSFTSHQLDMFASRFSRIVYLWQPNIDYDIVREESPDVVINQQVERFLVECPDDLNGPSHREYERRKLAAS